MKKYVCFMCVFGLMLSLFAACGKKEEAQIANPWQEAESLAAAAELVGFSLAAPDSVSYYNLDVVRACTPEDSRMIEVIYHNGDDEVRLRKAPGSDDISGDYNQYDSQAEVDVEGRSVSMLGNAEMVRVAVWQDGEYTYAVTASAGLPLEEMTQFIASVQ